MSSVSNPGDYLGMPVIWGRSKRQSLAYVNGRVLGKIQGWKQSALSFAGKEVLIKAVIQAIPTYPMNLFKFPAVVYKDLDSLFAGFWWGDTGGKKRIHWVEPIWFGGQLSLRRMGDGVSSFNSWIREMINLASHPHERSRLISIIAFSCWHIWKARCNYVINAITIVPSHVLHVISLSLASFWEAQRLSWVVAESDSLEVVSSLNGDISNGSWEVFPILENILRLGTSFQGCRWSWVPRSANQTADFLASRQNMEMCGNCWVRRSPSSLIHILNKDGLPCPP
ncbi:hypothetical protein ACFX15_001058 [Malus domestica]